MGKILFLIAIWAQAVFWGLETYFHFDVSVILTVFVITFMLLVLEVICYFSKNRYHDLIDVPVITLTTLVNISLFGEILKGLGCIDFDSNSWDLIIGFCFLVLSLTVKWRYDKRNKAG